VSFSFGIPLGLSLDLFLPLYFPLSADFAAAQYVNFAQVVALLATRESFVNCS
jgi:hypothetical protein